VTDFSVRTWAMGPERNCSALAPIAALSGCQPQAGVRLDADQNFSGEWMNAG